MIDALKKKYLLKFLKSHKVLRNKKIVSIQKAKSIAIVATITDEDSYKRIYSIFSNLLNYTPDVWLMGYIDDKLVPYFCLQQLKADFFCKKDLNWFGKPSFTQMNDFLLKEFDILVDLSDVPSTPLLYILNQSNAKFITGVLPDLKDYYDLYIQIDDITNKHEILNIIQLYLNKLIGE